MASEPVTGKPARNHFPKGKRQQLQPTKTRSAASDCDREDSFVFEANEAWKDFHSSLLRFYENGELCDVTLKVGPLCLVAKLGSAAPASTLVLPLEVGVI